MSQTIISLLIVILADVLPKLGVTLGTNDLTTTVQTIVILGAAFWAYVRRYGVGDINLIGVKK